MRQIRRAVLGLIVLLAGCQAQQHTGFAPLAARLEPVPGGGARYLVVANTSGGTLHNCTFSAYVWNNKNILMRPVYTRHDYASVPILVPGQSCRFHAIGRTIEEPINERISGVEIVGHCDEGYFRQAWLITENDQLRPMTNGTTSTGVR